MRTRKPTAYGQMTTIDHLGESISWRTLADNLYDTDVDAAKWAADKAQWHATIAIMLAQVIVNT